MALFPETFPIFYSMGIIVAASSSIFAWRFLHIRNKALNLLYSTPSVIVAGLKLSGKSSMIRALTNAQIVSHPFDNEIMLSYFKKGDRRLQFVELPAFGDVRKRYFQKLRKLNLRYILYIFDVSKGSTQIEEQIKDFKNIESMFVGIPAAVVANKIDAVEAQKLARLKNMFKNIHEISLVEKEVGKAKKAFLKKEFDDLSSLMHDISFEVPIKRKSRISS